MYRDNFLLLMHCLYENLLLNARAMRVCDVFNNRDQGFNAKFSCLYESHLFLCVLIFSLFSLVKWSYWNVR